MGEPIKIVVVAQTEEAAAKLQDFAKNSGGQLDAGLKQAAKSSHTNFSEGLGQNRLAMMELGHVGRATAEGLAAGISPLRVLALESPRILQSFSMMGISLATMAPYLIAAGAAAGVFALEWYAVMGGVEDTTKKIEEQIKALDKIPAIMEKIQTLTKAGLLSPAAANEYADYLGPNPKRKLYRHGDGSIDENQIATEEQYPHTGDPFQDQRLQQMQTAGKQLSPAEANDYVAKNFPPGSEEQEKAQAKLNDLMEKSRIDLLSGLEKEKAEIHDRYQKERDEIALTAKQAAGLHGPNSDAAVQTRLADLNSAEAQAVADAEAKVQDKRAAEQAASETQIRTEEANRTKEALQTVEDQITQMDSQEGVKRGQFAAVEYTMRVTAAQRAYYAGDIAEQEYTHLVTTAAKERAQAEASYNAEKKNTLALSQEIERAELEGKLAAINGDPFKNNYAKAQQSIPLYQDLIGKNTTALGGLNAQYGQTKDEAAQLQIKQKIADITRQQLEYELRLKEAEGEGNWAATYQKNLASLQSQWQNLSVSLTNGAFSVIQQGVSGMANALTSVIMGTKSAGAAFAQFGTQLLTSFIEMITEALLWAYVAIPVLTTLGVLTGGATASVGSAITIAAVAGAVGSVGAVMAAEGGLITGSGTSTSDSIAARLSHGEFVVNAEATRRVGPDFLQAINSGAVHRDSALGASKGSGAGGGKGGNVNMHFYDERPHPKDFLASPAGENMVVNIARKNRLKIGITT